MFLIFDDRFIELSLSSPFVLSSYLISNFIPSPPSLPSATLCLSVNPSPSSLHLPISLPPPSCPPPSSSLSNYPFSLFSLLPPSSKHCLMVCGLGYGVTKDIILEFFKDFKVHEKDVFFVDNQNGKFSGNAVINFEEESEMIRAVRWGNLRRIGNKEVELIEMKGRRDKG